MAITHIQSVRSIQTTTDQSIAYTSNVTAGSLLLVLLRESNNSTADPTITDTIGNTYSEAWQVSYDTNSFHRLYWARSTSGGANTVTINSTGTTATRLTIHEFGGTFSANPFGTSSTNSNLGSAASPYASPSINPTGAGLVFSGMVSLGGVAWSSAGAGFTLGLMAPNDVTANLVSGYQIVTGVGAINASFVFTGTATNAASGIATFYEMTTPPTFRTTNGTKPFSITNSPATGKRIVITN